MGKLSVLLLVVIGAVLLGCATGPTDTPVPTDTPIPTNTPTPEFEVMFDGKDCTVDGPAELPAGKHSFIFIDTSDFEGEVYLVYLQEGKTFQDHFDLQNEPGDWYPKPAWAYYDSRDSSKRLESNSRRVTLSTWNLDRVGEHTILCYVRLPPKKLWFAAPLMIIEPPSE